jgi:peptide/nickel transport system ATP-binding protein
MKLSEGRPSPILTVKNLSVGLPTDRGTVHAVDGISFALMPGQTLGLVGESGCGKSMLARAVMGLLPRSAIVPAQSEIIFQSTVLHRHNGKQSRKIIGKDMAMVLQDPMASLNPVMKIGCQITESLIHHMKINKKHALDRAVQLLQAVGIGMPVQRLGQYPHQLSGGLRQRVAIAIALSCNPSVLIADEPTTALDVTVQAEILDLLNTHRENEQMAMVLISHDLGVVAGRTDETAVMYAGQFVEHAPTSVLFQNARMPYTKALLDAIPLISTPAHTDLKSVAGNPPDLIDPPSGCRFSPRCPQVQIKCRITAPPFININGTDYGYACWYPLGSNPAQPICSCAAARG